MNKKYEWEESYTFMQFYNTALLSLMVSVIPLIIGILLPFEYFNGEILFSISIFSFILFVISTIIVLCLSTKNKYSEKFLFKVKKRYIEAETIKELKELKRYIESQSMLDDGTIRLSNAKDINSILRDIDRDIDRLMDLRR